MPQVDKLISICRDFFRNIYFSRFILCALFLVFAILLILIKVLHRVKNAILKDIRTNVLLIKINVLVRILVVRCSTQIYYALYDHVSKHNAAL